MERDIVPDEVGEESERGSDRRRSSSTIVIRN